MGNIVHCGYQIHFKHTHTITKVFNVARAIRQVRDKMHPKCVIYNCKPSSNAI